MFRKKCVVILYDFGPNGKGSAYTVGRGSYATLFIKAFKLIDEKNFNITNVLRF